jgi:glycosyltransferase involved in cell wall biosynthesis
MAFDIDHRRSFLKQALQQCDRIVVKSAYMRDYFAQHGVSGDRLVVLEDGEDTSWGPVQVRKDRSGVLRIGYIGHIIPPKGIHVLVQAVQQLKGATELLIFGALDHDPVYTETLKAMVGGDKHIHFRGSFAHDRIAEVLAQVDVLVVPSTWPETFCHVVREGFIAGMPVLGSDIGAIPDAIDHGKNGFLFRSGDVDDLSRYLQMIVDDPGILDRLREHIPAVRTVDQQVRELVDLYKSI